MAEYSHSFLDVSQDTRSFGGLMAKKQKRSKRSQPGKSEDCRSTKRFNNSVERCVKSNGHDPPHQDIFKRTWR
jgi:hypothetical protein